MPTPLLLLLLLACVALQLLPAPAPRDTLLPAPTLVSLPGLPAWRKGHVYLDVCSRQLVFSPQKLDAHERNAAKAKGAREAARRMRKYYRLKNALRAYTPMGGAVAEELEVV